MTVTISSQAQDGLRFSRRQAVVLEHALQLLADGGERALTTGRLARAACCSKESLYKWFGNRAGIIASMIAYQSTKVRTFPFGGRRLSARALFDHLLVFANDLLEVLEGNNSLALNRLAIAQSADGSSEFSSVLLEQGRSQVEGRAKSLLDAGRVSGLLSFHSVDEAFHVLYGLVVSDRHVQALLGAVSKRDRRKVAKLAVRLFLSLYGSDRLFQTLSEDEYGTFDGKSVCSRQVGYSQ
ncbi:TetR/AcrR family transcriptional regulator [Rhizobium sp. 2MFCol3.1]|uniref:TetR/AcrR family transcriptional regulator n=1 Tax=Rhizobium sp. 2MFCol3.1 TaxID=1246459 RepID=UPI00036DFD9A|nr:TetR/AcrR family transcriptional regulator [Rhizobium sp. 2MFCol3.1]